MSRRGVRKTITAVVAGGVVTLAVGWLLGWFSEDPAIAEVRQMQSKLADPTLKDADRRTTMEQIRTKMESLAPDVRRNLWEANREVFEKRMQQHINELLAMSPTGRAKALDADIDRMQKMRAEMDKRQANRPNGAPGRQGQGNRTLSDEERINRTKNRLDRSTPEMRALRNAYAQMINQRMKERGLPPPAPGRGRG